ncbi:MAG: hypothetical protein M1822_004771 [Bathelium mastoideum]|nr:MAG: hypothetical protein M1822_004771 [Bathelium mastoideum]
MFVFTLFHDIEIIARVGMFFTKASIVLLYNRLFIPVRTTASYRHGAIFWSIWFVFFWNLLYAIALVLAVAFECVGKGAIVAAGKQCVDEYAVLVCASVINVTTDIMILVIPIMAIKRLKIEKGRKGRLYAVFAVGILGVAASVARLGYQVAEAEKHNQTIIVMILSLMNVAEQFIGIIVSCAAPPIIGYGALNGILFATYNRTLHLLDPSFIPALTDPPPSSPHVRSGRAIFTAGAVAGLATFVVSAPTELVKCRAQVSHLTASPGARRGDGSGSGVNSWAVAQQLWREGGGVRGWYVGGGVTSVRDAVGYGFYFYAYETTTTLLHDSRDSPATNALKTLFCGGLAGCATWSSIFPLDVIKTRIQTQTVPFSESTRNRKPEAKSAVDNGTIRDTRLLHSHMQEGIRDEGFANAKNRRRQDTARREGAWEVGRMVWRAEGVSGLFRGFWVCNIRAFVVNAVQWSVYELALKMLTAR